MPEFLSRSIDHLGSLGGKLRDLKGTWTWELIQNADDAPNATSMTFNVGDTALIVDNDGVFSSCQHIGEHECPWKTDPSYNKLCDFHRFRRIASGDKRAEAGTTGAFGIGFTSVYEITDSPEIISSGQHWILHEDAPEDRRIQVCEGCERCTGSGLPGTRIILSWARDPKSVLRRALEVEQVSADAPQRIFEELGRSLPVAMLFLKQLRGITVQRNGQSLHAFQRIDDADHLILSDGTPDTDRIWHLVYGDFSKVAETLRAGHRGIEEKRSPRVTVAIPDDGQASGLLCACLPTQHETGLPFHINADFFPSNNRKRIILDSDSDYQSAWNRAALAAAARALGDSLERISALLGAKRFWGYLDNLKRVAEAAQGDDVFADFWKSAAPHLKSARIIYTTKGLWTYSSDSCLLLQKEEAAAIPVFDAVGLHVVHEDLRPHHNLLRGESVGVGLLDVPRLAKALADRGLTKRLGPNELPSFLANLGTRALLWGEIAHLLDRQQRTPKAKADDEQLLKGIALAPGRDSAIWPCGQLFVADDATIALFRSLGAEVPFVADDPAFAPLSRLCRRFDAPAAVHFLKKIACTDLPQVWKDKPAVLPQLFHWLENRRQEIFDTPGTKQALAELSIFPSSGSLRPLKELALPGNFVDESGLAELVDLSALGGRREFLRDLGMQELDFRNYALSHLPLALRGVAVPAAKRRAALSLVATKLGEIRDDHAVRVALASSSLVECADGEFRKANECYFDSEIVRICLGDHVHFAVLPSARHEAIRELYQWLGVTNQPRLPELVERIRSLTSNEYTQDIAQVIGKIIGYLGGVVTDRLPSDLDVLRLVPWLPARDKNDRWYRANELYAVFQDYLFKTQALFLDAPNPVQTGSRRLLEVLGIKLTPTASLVVMHLLHCADHAVAVNTEVYRFLNDKADDPALNQLKRKKCLLLGDRYLAPSQVFWGDHPFGRYRKRLSEDLRPFNNLLRRLDVRDAPDREDALGVLNEIAAEFGEANSFLDDDTHAVVMSCWQFLEKTTGVGSPGEVLGSLRNVKCVPNMRKVLNRPDWMFFENRAGLAAKFGEALTNNVIPRPMGAGEAMALAGVRQLGKAVETELLECVDPIMEEEMAARILSRRNQFGRVLESQFPGHDTQMTLGRLADIEYESAAALLIRYRLSAFNREWESASEEVPALYQPEQGRLLFARRSGPVPWPAIARELAIALFPDEDPGRIAASLKEVLAAESAEEAAEILDELGFAKLDTSDHDSPAADFSSGQLGAEENAPDDGLTETPEDSAAGAEAGSMTPEDAIKSLLGAGSAQPSPPPAGFETPESSGTGGHGAGARQRSTTSKGSAKKNQRPVLRSYLPPPGSSTETADDNEETQGRSPVDAAGVQRVLKYEAEHARIPKEMPHKNPGYDVESRDASGNVVRYIEVKSFSGKWNNAYAVLSRPQFDMGRNNDPFWLYVVEQAETDDFKIHRIPNPSQQANLFMFDDGWRATAEQDESE